MSKIAWIGTGVMGKSMVSHLLNQGDEVTVYNRTAAKAEALKEKGAQVAYTVADAVKDADLIFTIVGFPKDVEEVYTEIFKAAKPGAIAVDMTTSSPSLAVKLHQQGKEHQIRVLDAPVSGGDSGAAAGTLSIMVGGEEADFNACLPYFNKMGKSVLRMGPAGCGQHTKMANQIAIAGTVSAVAEAIVYAKANGLDPEKLLGAISKGAAGSWQMSNNGVKMLQEDYNPGFFIKHFIKDMRLAKEAATAQNVELPVLEIVLSMYEQMQDAGGGDLGTQAIIKHYEK